MKALLPWWQSCDPSLNSKIGGFLDHVLGNTRCTIQEEEEFTFIKFLLLKKSHLYGLYLTGASIFCLRVEFGRWDALADQRVWWELEEHILSVSIPLGLSWAVSAFLSLRCQGLLGIPSPAPCPWPWRPRSCHGSHCWPCLSLPTPRQALPSLNSPPLSCLGVPTLSGQSPVWYTWGASISWSWTRYLTFSNLSIFISEMEIKIATSWGSDDDWII